MKSKFSYGLIYQAINKVNNKSYIGRTSKSLKERIQKHIRATRSYSRFYYFQNALVKYGFNSFDWNILCYCNSKDELWSRETYFIDYFRTYKTDYNLTLGGDGSSITPEIREKIRRSKIGKNNPMYGKRGKDCPNFGAIRSKEMRKQISDSLKGHIPWNKGLLQSEKHRKGNSEGHKKQYIVTTPNGREIKIRGIVDFCKSFKVVRLFASSLVDVAKGNLKQHKGYKCRYAN